MYVLYIRVATKNIVISLLLTIFCLQESYRTEYVHLRQDSIAKWRKAPTRLMLNLCQIFLRVVMVFEVAKKQPMIM